MSFWPKLRRRSRGRKRSTSAGKANPYSTRDIDKYKVVHAESQSQRAQFASERGVSIELVRFVSRSSRGWVYLPSETPSPSTNPRSPVSQDGDGTISTPLDGSQEFPVPVPALPLPTFEPVALRVEREKNASRERGAESSSAAGNVVMGLDVKGNPRRVNRLVISRNLKDEAWLQISKTVAILFVKVLVFSRAVEESTALAFTVAVVVDVWNRGKGSFQRVFSSLAAQLLTTLKPYLSLQQRKVTTTLVLAAPKPVFLSSAAPEQLSVSNAMKVTPVAEDSDAEQLLRSSSFAFPVVGKGSGTTSPRFYVHQGQGNSSQIEIATESVSSVPFPLVESNKLPSTKPCQRLKSKLFKSSPARKGENSSPSTELLLSSDASTSSWSSSNSSPGHGKGCKKKSSSNSKQPSKAGGEDCDEVEQPESQLQALKKINRSHELFFFRSAHNRTKDAEAQKEIAVMPTVASADVKNLSASHELKFSLRSLGRKKVSRSQELTGSSPQSPVQDLTLPKSTVDRLESLAFPFKMERPAQHEERPSVPSSPRQSTNKRRTSLSKMMAMEPTYEKYSSRSLVSGSSPPRGSSPGESVKGGRKSKTASSSSTSVTSTKTSAMLAPEELKPGLRRVRTAVSGGSEQHGPEARRAKTVLSRSSPAPLQSTGELGRSQLLSREILGSILLLGVLGFLLLGRIPAIFCMACLCLILSHFQRVFHGHFTPGDQEQLKRSPVMSRLHHATSNPAHWPNGNSSNHGSPAHETSGLQSSEYRKRVVIEGLLDRGRRRGSERGSPS